MFYLKKVILLFCLECMLLLCACQAKEAVMLEAELGTTECTSFEEIENISYEKNETTIENNLEEEYIFVYISGEVKNPGVYQVIEDARIYEVVIEAGGYTIEADEIACNLAAKVSDGMHIHIANKNDESTINSSSTGNTDTGGKVNLNSASLSDLTSIPGIGMVKAEAIIAYREIHGNFQSIEDVMEVDGIKSGTYENIKEYIEVRK